MTIAAAQLREWITANFPGTPISRFACRNTASGAISQHSAYGSPVPEWTHLQDSNALDVFGPGKTTSPSDQAHIQRIVDAINADGQSKWSIRKIIWRDGGAHENHAHIDFYPMIEMKKWCGGPETPSWRYSSGHSPARITSRNPEPENGRYDGDGSVPIPPPSGGNNVYLPLVYSDGFSSNPARKEDVKWLQTALERAGYDIGSDGVDGAYGNDTASAVSAMMGSGDGRNYGHAEHDKLLTEAYSGSGSGQFIPHTHDTDDGSPS